MYISRTNSVFESRFYFLGPPGRTSTRFGSRWLRPNAQFVVDQLTVLHLLDLFARIVTLRNSFENYVGRHVLFSLFGPQFFGNRFQISAPKRSRCSPETVFSFVFCFLNDGDILFIQS